MRSQYVFLIAKSRSFISFIVSIIISGDAASYFLEMVMLISLKGSPTQTRMGIRRLAFPCKGPMRGQYVLFMEKSRSFYMFYIFNYYFWRRRV